MLDLNTDNVAESFGKIADAIQELSDKVKALEDKDQPSQQPELPQVGDKKESKPEDLKDLV